MIAYRLRYEPFNQTIIELSRNQAYGPIRAIEASNVQDVKAPNIRLSKKLAGGPVGDVGIYCINATRYITGEEPVEVMAMAHHPSEDPPLRRGPGQRHLPTPLSLRRARQLRLRLQRIHQPQLPRLLQRRLVWPRSGLRLHRPAPPHRHPERTRGITTSADEPFRQ